MISLLAVGNDPTIALPPESVVGDTHQRQLLYASILKSYHLITQAPLIDVPPRIQLASNFWVYPCGRRGMAHYIISAVRVGWRVVRQRHIQVVSAQDPFVTGFVAYLIARRYQLPLSLHFVADALDNPLWLREKPIYPWLNRLAHFLIRRAVTYRVVSSQERNKLIGMGISPEAIWNLPSISDFERFLASSGTALRRTWMGSCFRHILLCVARLSPQKDLNTLIRAMAQVVQKHPDTLLVIVGDGPLDAAVRHWINDRGLDQHVRLLGAVRYGDLPSYYAAADVLVLSSIYEGNARVLAEAAASAKPVVCTDVSGATDTVIDGATGYVVPVGDAAALAARLNELLDAPDVAVRMGERAQEHVLAQYDPQRILEGFRVLWETTARRRTMVGNP